MRTCKWCHEKIWHNEKRNVWEVIRADWCTWHHSCLSEEYSNKVNKEKWPEDHEPMDELAELVIQNEVS